MKKYIIAGNWKMNLLIADTKNLIEEIKIGLLNLNLQNVDILVCPPFTNLNVAKASIGNSPILLGAQNMHFEEKGAFTGEVSPKMLKDSGCDFVILGHSERRQYFKEDNEILIKKIKSAFANNLKPVFCIGETLEQRNQEITFKILENQLEILRTFEKNELENLVIAYEPVWAIGTGVVANNEQISEVHSWINDFSIKNFGISIPILYGGSMNDKNSLEILQIENVAGGLIGGASLKADSFLTIIQNAIKASSK